MEEYKVTNTEIIYAILNHTTGRPGMTLWEKLVFVADYIEPTRNQAPNLHEVRILAFQDIDAAMIKILEDTLEYLKNSGGEIDPMTEKTYEYFCEVKRWTKYHVKWPDLQLKL